ncbi:NADH-quinone oxidoreductase subunit H, partial [Candidatus Omnitrophota bacterium]
MKLLFTYFIFPGFLFSAIAGGLGWWVERKLTARFQFRVGPPWYQNFMDILKLFAKEIVIPKDAQRSVFILSPIISLSACVAVSLLIGQGCFVGGGFAGDALVILYVLMIPSLFLILGGFSSSNPLATCGASREIKLM